MEVLCWKVLEIPQINGTETYNVSIYSQAITALCTDHFSAFSFQTTQVLIERQQQSRNHVGIYYNIFKLSIVEAMLHSYFHAKGYRVLCIEPKVVSACQMRSFQLLGQTAPKNKKKATIALLIDFIQSGSLKCSTPFAQAFIDSSKRDDLADALYHAFIWSVWNRKQSELIAEKK